MAKNTNLEFKTDSYLPDPFPGMEVVPEAFHQANIDALPPLEQFASEEEIMRLNHGGLRQGEASGANADRLPLRERVGLYFAKLHARLLRPEK